MPFCSFCGTQISDTAKFCLKCGEQVIALESKTCYKCGTQIKDGDRFCVNCGAPIQAETSPVVKAQETTAEHPEIVIPEAVSEYLKAKETAIEAYKKLLVYNPFAPADELRDMWKNMSDQLEAVYVLSQKKKETKNLGLEMQNYVNDAKNRSNYYAFEIEYDKYQEALSELCKDLEKVLTGDDSDDDAVDMLTKYQRLYKRSTWLSSNYNRFKQYDIDPVLIRDLHGNIAYYYCVELILRADDIKDKGYFESSYDIYKQCIDVASLIHEERFNMVCGYAYFNQAIAIEDSEKRGSRLFKSKPSDDLKARCINSSLNYYRVLENYSYCSRTVKNHAFSARMKFSNNNLRTWEWIIMDASISKHTCICDYRQNYRKKNLVIDIAIKAQKEWLFLGEEWSQQMIEEYYSLKK